MIHSNPLILADDSGAIKLGILVIVGIAWAIGSIATAIKKAAEQARRQRIIAQNLAIGRTPVGAPPAPGFAPRASALPSAASMSPPQRIAQPNMPSRPVPPPRRLANVQAARAAMPARLAAMRPMPARLASMQPMQRGPQPSPRQRMADVFQMPPAGQVVTAVAAPVPRSVSAPRAPQSPPAAAAQRQPQPAPRKQGIATGEAMAGAVPTAHAAAATAKANALRKWLTPRTMRQDFILTELLQPPLSIR